MDGNRFDALARVLHTRRGVVRALAGSGVAVGLARGAEAARKKKGGGSSFGCAKRDSLCTAGSEVPCPNAPSGICVTNNKGKPVCIVAGVCAPCKRKADCPAVLGPTVRCFKCPLCKSQGSYTLCVVPQSVAPTG